MNRHIDNRPETINLRPHIHDEQCFSGSVPAKARYADRIADDAVISIIIPTRSRTDLLKRAVTSALRQSYRYIEIVIVVDGPDSATESYLQSLSDSRVRYIPLAAQVGGSEARNIGVRSAIGHWVAFLDDDDAWMATKLEKQMALARASENRGAVIACKVVGRYPQQEHIWPTRLPATGEPICEYLFNRKSWFRGEGQITTSCLLASRDLMLSVPFTAGLPKHQDTDWYIRAAAEASTEFLFVEEPLVIWYLGEARDTVVRHYDWQRSWSWLLSVREFLTRRSFAGFIATQLAGEAAAQGATWDAAPFLLRQMFICGRPGVMDIALFVGNCILTPAMRNALRGAFSRRRVARTL
jgi:glycosyltransferase involved in cell wall biosynthesis